MTRFHRAKRGILVCEMANTDFDAFVRRQRQSAAASEKVDWNARRDEWLQSVRDLYSEVRSLLKSYIDSGDIVVTIEPIMISEENIGVYHSERLVLAIGPQQVRLNPVGTLVIGARGRLDMVGPAGSTRLVLVPDAEESAKLRWKIATSPPSVSLIDLNAQTLMQAILEVADG
jgi:hypothetical protein